jgi:ATP-dependent Clp protease ATP-binding subunit ClpA
MSAGRKKAIIRLDPEMKSAPVEEFERNLLANIVGQNRAVRSIASIYQVFRAGLSRTDRPLGIMLFLGPTGSGKTRVVEAAAESLFGDRNAVIKIDCAEFQHSHEIAKLVGSPPGYLGHRETPPLLTQENLGRYRTEKDPFTLVLFDEIEKASDELWYLLLGVLDKATLTLGDNRKVDFSQTMIFMTSNLGAKEMSNLITGSIGFAPARGEEREANNLDQKIYRTALDAAKRKFSPEFMNRIDKIIVFRTLTEEHMRLILDLELSALQRLLFQGQGTPFMFALTDGAKQFLLTKGTDYQYGARHLKRAVDRFLVNPFANLVSSEQVHTGDLLLVDFDPQNHKLTFSRDESEESAARAALLMVKAQQVKGADSRVAA